MHTSSKLPLSPLCPDYGKIPHSFSFGNPVYIMSCLFFMTLVYPSFSWSQQACDNSLDGTVIAWTQPSQIDPMDERSLRWPVDASLRFGFSGSWCPSREEISFVDEDGVEIPADITFEAPDILVPGGPPPLNMGLINPLMSLQTRHDYTFTLSPPDPALTLYDQYTVVFRTSNKEMGDFKDFEGIKDVGFYGDFCEEDGFIPGNVDQFDCVVPSQFELELSFMPLSQSEAGYFVYRTKSIPADEEQLELTDEVQRLAAFVPGVHPDFIDQPVKKVINVQYSPLPRTDCFKVVAVDEWGRPRGGGEVEKCIELDVPPSCPPGCEESGMCFVIFPPPNVGEVLPPLEGARCAPIGINGASGRTPVPPLQEETEEEDEMEMEMEEEEMTQMSTDEGCQNTSDYPYSLNFLLFMIFGVFVSTRKLKLI